MTLPTIAGMTITEVRDGFRCAWDIDGFEPFEAACWIEDGRVVLSCPSFMRTGDPFEVMAPPMLGSARIAGHRMVDDVLLVDYDNGVTVAAQAGGDFGLALALSMTRGRIYGLVYGSSDSVFEMQISMSEADVDALMTATEDESSEGEGDFESELEIVGYIDGYSDEVLSLLLRSDVTTADINPAFFAKPGDCHQFASDSEPHMMLAQKGDNQSGIVTDPNSANDLFARAARSDCLPGPVADALLPHAAALIAYADLFHAAYEAKPARLLGSDAADLIRPAVVAMAEGLAPVVGTGWGSPNTWNVGGLTVLTDEPYDDLCGPKSNIDVRGRMMAACYRLISRFSMTLRVVHGGDELTRMLRHDETRPETYLNALFAGDDNSEVALCGLDREGFAALCRPLYSDLGLRGLLLATAQENYSDTWKDRTVADIKCRALPLAA